jgi:hypothetical protein
MKTLMMFIVGVSLLLSTLYANANIIDDTHGIGSGSFELGDFVNGSGSTPFSNIAGYMGLLPGSTAITGWTVGGPGDGVDWLTDEAGNNFIFNAHEGIHSVDLQHLTGSSIFTEIPTITGLFYELSFFAASVQGFDNTGTVSAGSLTGQSFTAPYSTTFQDQLFQQFSFSFSAIDTVTKIQFSGFDSINAQLQYGPVIDSVAVTLTNSSQPVPEPTTIFLIGTALIGLVASSATRKNK